VKALAGISLLALVAGAALWIGRPDTIHTRAISGVAAAHTAQCSPAPAPTTSGSRTLAAVARTSTVAYRRPGSGVLARFALRNADRFPTVFAVLAVRRNARCEAEWYRVRLPIRPNGATGWVRARSVAVGAVDTEIVIHRAARRLELLRAGHVVLRSPISTGAPDMPTPLGRFYVKERLIPTDPNGPWGPAALGTSAYSDVLKSWVEGGPIGIHGTDDPSAIGRAVSHGCIRLPNDAMRRLYALTPAGTPIVILR
jgi:lipoprotein-anchoring transpeptidase ErfK/SrfK